ncbi:hypothetical protein ABIA24_006368 [Sinorhizobium fredii]|nr:hypothetical protein [Sinorhizobium fredii]
MKSDIGNFGRRFRPVEFLIRFYLVMALGTVVYFTFYGVFW